MPEGQKVHKCEVYSRVVGYLSPVSEWNKGKTEEFGDRQEYDIPEFAKRGKANEQNQKN